MNRRKNSSKFEKDNNRGGYLLWIVTPVAASVSVAIVVAALAGPHWLYTEEKLPNVNYNGTANFNVKDDGAFITKYTKSSLWIICSTFQGMESYNCIKIDYFPKEEYHSDPHDSTMAIPYTITKSSPFFLISAIFLLISFIVFLVATCSHQNCLCYFASGILFIVSGLLMLIGLIVYISIFKAEIGSKLRPKSTLQPPLFTFTYGQSFFLYVFGFVSTEFVGVLNIFLYISFQQVGNHKTIPCLSFATAQEKIMDVESSEPRSLHAYDERNSSRSGSFVCRKHSGQQSSLRTFPYIETEHRYYFEKPQKCNLHSKSLAKSLNELYTEPAPIFAPFDLPQEFPLTRSVSTTTELFSTSNTANNSTTLYQAQSRSPMLLEKRNKKNQTNDESSSKDSLNDICGLSRSILSKGRKSKDELFNEFCRRAGMRPKPKDIYYIEEDNPAAGRTNGDGRQDGCDGGDEPEDGNVFIVDNYVAAAAAASLTKNRRNSFMEPRKRNSNLSLRTPDKVYPKSLFDLDRWESEQHQQWNNCSADHYFSHHKSSSRDLSSGGMYQSRTLPRCSSKRNFYYDNMNGDVIGGGGGGYADGNFHGREHRRSLGFEGCRNYSSSENMLHKSFDELNGGISCGGNGGVSGGYIPTKQANNLRVQWPTAIPTSPSGYSTKSTTYGISGDQAGYYSKYNFCRPQPQLSSFKDYNKQTHQHHGQCGTFDLDRIERERRKSHASLFEAGTEYDFVNGTAV